MVVCRMTLMVCKKKRSKIEIEKKSKWWKLKKEECCEEFRQKLRQALGGQVVLPDDWETTAEVIRETGRKVLGVSSGRRKEDKETWWWNEEVQDSIQRKRLAKKKWDMDRTEENRQEYKELQRRVKREVSKAKLKAYDELYTRLDTREGEKDLYRLARQRDRDGKDVQQVRVIKDRDGRVLTSEESVQRRWKEYFEELMNEENEREKRVEGVNSVEQKVDKIRKDEVRKALKRMKSGKAVGPDDIPVEVWKCLGEAAVEFLTSLFNRVLESQTEEFKVEVGLHQGSALSPFLFAIVMDQLSEEVRQESPWTMMFADDIVICSESREQVEENLERWRFALERRGMKVSRSKTEYMCVNEREGSGTVRLQGEEVKKVQEFKYLGSTVQSNGECGKEVKKRVQAGWNGWRKVSGVLCDQKISARIKGKVYRTVVRPAMLYGLETVSLRKRQESELEVAELKMLRFSLGVTRLDRIRNEYIRGTAHVGRLGDKVREARLRWFGHVQRRESEYIGRRMLDMELPGRTEESRFSEVNHNRKYKVCSLHKQCLSLLNIMKLSPVFRHACSRTVNPRGTFSLWKSSVPRNRTGFWVPVRRAASSSIGGTGASELSPALSFQHTARGNIVREIIQRSREELAAVMKTHPDIKPTLAIIQGAGGNWATVGRRSRGGRRVHRQREKRKGKSVGLRIGTLNVGTMTGKGRELADMMERRKVDILCVQETRWKGSKARSIGAGFKLFYYGVDSKRNGVGVVLKEEFVRNVLEVKRVSDRVISLKLEFEGVMLNVVSGYAPQVGCELEEKERFWSELDEVMESIPTGERVVIGADFNGHVGEGNTGDEEVMGKFGVKERNLEGQMVVDFAKRMDMGVVNTYFQKREEHRVTYMSGGRRTQVDYILCRRGNLKEISDCKVVVGESVARQHRMVVCRMTFMVCKMKRSKIEKKSKWWKLKKEECCEEFRQKLRQALGGQVVLPDDWETTAEVIRETGRKVLGVSSGRRKEDKETWWWNEEVQDSIQRKRLAKKKWDMDRTEENRQEYKELQRRVKREVSKAKQKAYEELYTRLDTREGEKDLYRLARQRDRDGKDVQQVRVIKDRDGRVLTSEESVQRRWKEYFEELMNEENEREKRVEGVNSVEQKVDKIRKDEVRKALKRMKSGKAVGPDDIPVEVWKCLGEAAVEFLANLFNRVLESERMPEEWRRSVLVPIFKNKGDVQSCSNYRGIKLMSHTMKVWERVVEARLRKVVEICEQQYGFMPRKSTTDAIFALRILMEKYRDGQRELHCVFVDLEKAYDRVPREELWYCMRKSGVAEKYVRVVQDMYERSRTVVRCAVGQTEEFNVEVGLHQGSALSPFLFAIVMDQLSEEVRQESPWTMMFADDIVICSESREQVEENLERWRFALERRGMKVSRSKTEYMCVNEREGSGTVRLQGEEVKKVQEFKYLGSTVQSNGECGKEVKKRVQAGWNGWRKVSGVLCDQKISARIKGKVYRTVVRPAMLYGLETVSLRKRQESELEAGEDDTLLDINKKMAGKVGLNVMQICLPSRCTQEEVIEEVLRLNEDPNIHGVFLCLPPSFLSRSLINSIKPEKDTDGVSDLNLGRLVSGAVSEGFLSPVTGAVVELLARHGLCAMYRCLCRVQVSVSVPCSGLCVSAVFRSLCQCRVQVSVSVPCSGLCAMYRCLCRVQVSVSVPCSGLCAMYRCLCRVQVSDSAVFRSLCHVQMSVPCSGLCVCAMFRSLCLCRVQVSVSVPCSGLCTMYRCLCCVQVSVSVPCSGLCTMYRCLCRVQVSVSVPCSGLCVCAVFRSLCLCRVQVSVSVPCSGLCVCAVFRSLCLCRVEASVSVPCSAAPLAGKKAVLLGLDGSLKVMLQCLLQNQGVEVQTSRWSSERLHKQVKQADVVVLMEDEHTTRLPHSCFKPGATLINCSPALIPAFSAHEKKPEPESWPDVGPVSAALRMQNVVRSSRKWVEGQQYQPWKLRPLKLQPLCPVPSDIEISRAQTPKPIVRLAEEIGLLPEELEAYGRSKAK
ncbi:hypothetical protein QTP86_030397, partial [Hemibagrus guttatus]